LTDAGRQLAVRAANILAEGEAVEGATVAQATVPRGLIRLVVPMSFGQRHVAPLLPEFFATFPEVSIDLHLSDAKVDLIGEGFDAAIRIAVLTESTLVARRLCEMPRYVVGSPGYLNAHGDRSIHCISRGTGLARRVKVKRGCSNAAIPCAAESEI
jgi:DNA-binding transcriptional LysR family regulator